MAERAVCTNRKALFVVLGLGLAVVLTMLSLKLDTRKPILSNPIVLDGGVFEQGGVMKKDEVDAVQLTGKELQAIQDAAGSDGAELHVLEAFRKWDAEVGCAQYRNQLRDQQENSSFRSLQPAELSNCADLQLQHVSVLVKASTWIPDALNGLQACGCGLTCLWTKSRPVADDPDLHFYEGSRPRLQRKQGEPLRAYLDMEAGASRSQEEDLFVSYHASAEVQATYASIALAQNRNHYISSTKRTDVLVYWSSSRCVTGRQAIAQDFLARISHHSFGKCLNNVGRKPGAAEDPLFQMYPECKANGGQIDWTRHIHCAMSHYMFALAIENTMTESYVTEKLFYALDAGTVPIYFGAPNVLDLVPPHSIILGTDFNSTEELVAYVKAVAGDPVKYAEFHAWRRCGELRNYRHTWAVSFDNMPCRLCATVSKLGGKHAPATY